MSFWKKLFGGTKTQIPPNHTQAPLETAAAPTPPPPKPVSAKPVSAPPSEVVTPQPVENDRKNPSLENELRERFSLTLHDKAWGFCGQRLQILEQLDDPKDVIQVLKRVRSQLPFSEVCVLASKPSVDNLQRSDHG